MKAREAKPNNKETGQGRSLVSNANQRAIRMRMGEVGECDIGLRGRSAIPLSGVPEMLLRMTILWFLIWFVSDLVGDREVITFDPVNWWAGFLLLAAALDLNKSYVVKGR